ANPNTLNTKTPPPQLIQSSGNIKTPNPNTLTTTPSPPQYIPQQPPSIHKPNQHLHNNSKNYL
ncbi:hypothetical protein, partial [Staphylococcus epidermidis]|uniref:hypothetical protein n=1 Tax=Staphylococcus epidermidis TaxID=1282 RepID=UPI001C92D53C